MNTAFTNYAEKKAKQILNLLQGHTKGIRLTAILILLLMGVSNAWGVNRIYLKPNSNWTSDGARFAAYFFGNGEKWVSMTCYRDFYSVEVPSGFTKVIFCRMNPSAAENNWNNKWNQSGDLTIPTNGNNLFTVPSGSWDGSTESWSKHTPADQVVYLKPTDQWNKDGARFAAYAFNGCDNKWIDLDEIGCAGEYYTCTIPDKYHQVIFGRMAPNGTNGWTENTQIWNKSGDLTIDKGKCYTISSIGNGMGTAASGSWGTYTASTYSITTNAGTGGTITVSKFSGIALNEQVDVIISTSEGYTYKSGTITIGTNAAKNISEGTSPHTICGPTTINAQWTPNTYTVTFNQNYATTNGATSVIATYDSPLPSIADNLPTKIGYKFEGYWDEEGGTGTQYYKADGTSFRNWDKTSGCTLFAKWEQEIYTITLDNQGGDGTTSVTTTYGAILPQVTPPTKIGYVFKGYNEEADGTGLMWYPETGICELVWNKTSDATLYAQWEARKLFLNASWLWGPYYTMQMNQDANDPKVYTYKHTEPAEKRKYPSYHNFRFVHEDRALAYGWQHIDEDVTTNYDTIVTNISNDGGYNNIIFSLTRKSDIIITLTLQNDDPKPTVHIDANPYYTIKWMDGQGNQIGEVQELHAGETITPPADPSREGYTFAGWGNPPTMPADDVTYTAQWTANQYSITYKDQNNATFSGTHADGHPTTHTYGTATTLKTATKTGYTFGGWFDNKECTGTAIESLGATAYTANITLYAKWTQITVSATITPTDGTTGTNNLTFSINSNVPTNSGYYVGVYNFGENDYASGYINGDIAFTSNPTSYTATYTQNTAGTYYTRAFVMKESKILATSEKIAFTVNAGSSASTVSEWKMYNGDTELGTFTNEGNDTYTLTITIPEGGYNQTNYRNDLGGIGTPGAISLVDNEQQLVINNGRIAWLDGAGTFTITIRKDGEQWKISATHNIPITVTATEGGTVSPSGTVEVGNRTPTTFTATPAPGYRFDRWDIEGDIVAPQDLTNPTIDITANGTGTLTANFVRVHTVNFFATPAAAGTATATVDSKAITSGDKLDDNTSVTFTADVANAYNGQCTFVRWVDGAGNPLSNNATYNHTVKEDITVKAIFKIKQYTLTFSASDGGYVSATANNSAIASPANLDYNTSVTLTAEPDAGSAFDGWYEGSTKKSSETSYSITLTANKTIEARFTKGTTIFFKPVDYWKEADARFAVYTWGGSAGDKWIEFEDYGCNEDIFTAEIPAGYTGFKIVRLKPASADGYNSDGDGFNWDNKWNETENLTIPTGDKNLYDMNNKTITKLYFTPHENWKQDNARFAAYFFGNGDTWVDLTHHNDGIYACDKPSGYTKVIFCRMNPSAATNNWNNKWNQTGNIDIPTNGQNHYTIIELGNTWDDIKNADWSTLFDDSRWTTYDAPSYKLTIQSTANGTVAVSKVGGGALDNDATIKLGDEIKITFTPAVGYELINYFIEYATATDKADTYTVCGPTEITAEFELETPSRTVYLRPNDDWMKDNPVFAARVRKSSGGNDKWYVMHTNTNDYTGSYSCNIPNDYDKIIFVRLNPKGSDAANDGFNWTNAWNQTKELTIIDKDNDKTNDHKLRFAIGDKIVGGDDNDRYDGKWEENTPIWGLATNFNDWKAEKAVFKGYPGKLDVAPPFGTSHEFKLYNFFGIEASNNLWHGNSGTMKRANSGQWWTMEGTQGANCKMMLDVKGDYIYQMRFLTVGAELRKQISVTYPEANMYYLMYEEETDEGSKQRISYGIGLTGEERLDTVSFFVDIAKSAKIYILDGNQNKVGDPYTIIGTGGQNPGGAMAPQRRTAEDPTLRVEQGCGIEASGVYNFVAQQDANNNVTLLINDWHAYTGAYYIRTDAASGGWGGYKQNGNKMTYTSYADKNHNFDHYYCKWVESSQSSYANVKFCVANDYSHKLSDEWDGDEIIDNQNIPTGCLPANANVRFGWNSKTNELSRAYIAGSSNASDRFLVLEGNKYLLDIEGNALKVSGLNPNEAIFSDKQNWIYQLDVQANNNTKITLTAKYNDKVQTFFGTSKSGFGGEPIMQATNEDYHKVRMIYDFKTNNLIAAWLLDETQYPETKEVASNMLIIRENQGVANQINFTNIQNQDMEINTAYAVMTFTKNWVTGAATRDRSEYWVSFPFDVKISDVFGFSEYGDKWIMQLYDGAERAEKGNWIDSPTFWKYITNRNYTLKAGVGYVLKLNLNKMDFPNNSTDASLFFPSQGIPTVINADPTPITVPAHECTIERDNRNIYDSHWNLIGVPGYANLENLKVDQLNQTVTIENEAHNLAFYYEYDAANNSYNTSLATATFKNMYAYMVQYAGDLEWTNIQETPAQLAARRNSDTELEKAIFRLELAQGEKMADQTFVQLQQEGATPEFDMNLDLTKIINSGANIYTLVGNSRIQTAGNALPMDEAMVVPVGVKIDAEGEYTFRMPDGTEGMVVELIDYETYNRTNLLLTDYTVTLPKGTNEYRFALHIQPQKDVVTSLENIGEGVNNGEAVNKYLIDGKLIIRTADGVVYDAQGKRL